MSLRYVATARSNGSLMGVPVKPDVDLVLKRLREGRLDAFINSFEWAEFECKASPYQLDVTDQKFELAKDVSALANVDGGVILIGAKTEVTEYGRSEFVKEIRAFPSTLVDVEQMQDVLHEWLYPVLRNIDIRWYPSANDPQKGVVAVHVPKAPAEARPIIVAKVLKETGKIRGNVFGLFERWQDDTTSFNAEQLYGLIRSGQNSRAILERLDVLQASLEATRSAKPKPHVAQTPEDYAAPSSPVRPIRDLSPRAVDDVGLNLIPTYLLQGQPLGPVSLPGLFATRESAYQRLIQDPPQLRYGGFGVDGGGPAEINRGKAWRAMQVAGHRILELRNDGSILFAAPADETFLCWGRRQPPQGKRVNPLALIESAYLFAELLRQLQQLTDPKDVGYTLSISFDRAKQPEKTLFLAPGRLDAYGWGTLELCEAPEDSVMVEESWAKGQIIPEELGFDVVAQVYAWFGLTHDRIPFTRDNAGRKVINVEEIKTLR